MKKNKKEKQNINLKSNKLDVSPIYLLSFMGLWALILVPPYVSGLFFPWHQNTALIFAAVIFGIWWFAKVKDEGVDILNNPMDWLVVGLIISYIIASFGAFSQELAVAGVVKQLLYFNVFWLASRLVIDYSSNISLINVMIVSAVGVALLGLATAMDWIYIHYGFIGDRIYSTLQYPNTLAGYLLTISILALALWQNSQKNFRYLYIVLIYVMMLVFVGTNSRGAFLLVPVVLALTIANPWLKNKIEACILWFIILVTSLIAGTGFRNYIADENTGFALLAVCLGLSTILAGQYVLEKIREREIIKSSWPQGKIVLIGLAIIFIIGIFSWDTVLPDHISERFATVSLYEASSGARVYWAMEAVTITNNEGPVFGLGGGAWQASFRYFQSYFYLSTQVHNDFAQTLMEIGYIGLIFFVGLWFVMFYLGYRNLKAIDDDKLKNIQWAIMVAAVCLGLRGLMDFDFQLSAVTIVLFVLFGMTVGIYRQHYPYKTWFKGATIPVLVVSAVFIVAQLILPTTLAIAHSNAQSARAAVWEGNAGAAIHHFERAIVHNPFSSQYRIELARLYSQLEELEKAEEYIMAAIERDRFNRSAHSLAATIYFNKDNFTKAVEFQELTRDLNRWYQGVWNDLANMYYMASLLLIQSGQFEEAEIYLERLVQMPAEISARMDTLGERENILWPRNRLTTSPLIYLYSGVGNYFLDNLELAENYFNRAQDLSETEALWWLALLKERQGQMELAMEFQQRALEENPGFENNFHGIRNMQNAWWNRR